MGMEALAAGLGVKYVPDQSELQTCIEYGRTIADKVKSLPRP